MNNQYFIEGNCVRIILHRPKNKPCLETFIDLEDFDKVNAYEGSIYPHYIKKHKVYYASVPVKKVMPDGTIKKTTVRLHRIVLDFPDRRLDVDHIDHNRLNNRKSNLRAIPHKKNTTNRGKLNTTNKSGYRNVTWMGAHWRVYLQIDGKPYTFPEKFDDVHEAGRFAEQMRQKYYGEYAGVG